jgi:hypothetical protein
MSYPIDGLQIYTTTQQAILQPQYPRPICYVPPECNLTLSVGTITPPSVRNGDDGTIAASFTSTGGTTATWYLNGVSWGVHGTGYTFTGLTSGTYYISVEQAPCEDESGAVFVPQGEFKTGDFTVVGQPVGLSCVNKPIILNLATATNTNNPLPSKATFTVTGTINDGDSINITLDYPQVIDLTFYAKDVPDRSSYFLTSVLDDGSTNNATEIATSIAEALSSTILNRLYYIRSENQYVYIQARENNGKLDFTSDNVTISGNITLTTTQYGIAQYDGSIVANYSLWTDILVQQNLQYGATPNTSNFLKQASIELPYNAVDNQHKFDLAPVLRNFVSTPLIDFNATNFFTLPSMIAAYYCSYGERYPLIENSLTKKRRVKGSTTPKYVINSSLEWEVDNDLTDYVGTYIHDVKAGFDGVFSGAIGNQTLTINDIYFSTGTTANTTGIQYKLTNGAQTIGWQTSNALAGITGTSAGGNVYVSGVTSGATFVYRSTWYSNTYGSDITQVSKDYLQNLLFLSEQPNPKTMQRDSTQFEYILLPAGYGRILKVIADMDFYNGDTLTGETLYQITTSANTNNVGAVFCLPSGYEQLSLDQYENPTGSTETRKIRRLDFRIYQTDDAGVDIPFTEEKSYRFEIDQQPSRYEVAWLGEFGTWQTFSFIGEIVEGVQREVGTYEVPIEATDTGSYLAGFQKNTIYDCKLTKTIKLNSGWLDSAHRDYLLSLLKSNRIYSINEGDVNFLLIESVDQAQKSTNETLYQVNITAKLTSYFNNVAV